MSSKKFIPAIVVAVVFLSAICVSGYLIYNFFQSSELTHSDSISSAAQVRKLVESVGKLVDLPIGEEPSVITITDAQKLKDQSFFANPKNGDKVLLYIHARKAILYDPQSNKVLEVAPMSIGTPSAQTTTTPSTKVVLRNGTTTVGLTTKIETELKKTISDLNVTTKENASKSDFTKTTVVILSDRSRETGNKIAEALKSSVGALPAGETKPTDADIVVILGKDRT